MIRRPPPPPPAPRDILARFYLADERSALLPLLEEAELDHKAHRRVQDTARRLVEALRERSNKTGGLDAFVHEYDLSSEEGVVLMCLAEALLRIPDADTADRLIRDKLGQGEWVRHLGRSPSLFVNASTWGLMLTGQVVALEPDTVKDAGGFLRRLVARSGEPVIRLALKQAMRIMGEQFVMGRTITEALARTAEEAFRPCRFSFDMLGEAALTADDAGRYFQAYRSAIRAVAADTGNGNLFSAPSVSVKLSALHPRYDCAQTRRVRAELTPRLRELVLEAQDAKVALTLDAEEAERLELSLDLFEAVFRDPALAVWEGFGLAVQAYQKRAPYVIDYLVDLAREVGKRIPLRLVKGAYWDSEIKRAQQAGLEGYPVYTRKCHTDVAYLACVQRLLAVRDALYPQFATHNAHTVAYVLEAAGTRRDFEFQRLHGMGEALYSELLAREEGKVPVRIYAPVGSHEDLLPYLVRRLLENGANTSFVNRLEDEKAAIDDVIADPVTLARRTHLQAHPRIPLPLDLYPDRRNARGINLADREAVAALESALQDARAQRWQAAPIVDGRHWHGPEAAVMDPADHGRQVGTVMQAAPAAAEQALASASRAAPAWDATAATDRARILDQTAELLETHHSELIALCVREGGKTLADAVAEVREAVDFCRYYAHQARRHFSHGQVLQGPTGEYNELRHHGRGVFACISPWNFPLAIFTGQVSAALAAGNAVLAKPAGATPLVAHRVVQLLHEAGVPPQVLHFLPAPGGELGPVLAGDERISGIAFTGSTDTAQWLNRRLAARAGAIVPLIAETGGLNAMIVDSSALPEQVVKDVIRSAFNSAGQRCSALRVLFLQEDIAERVLTMLGGAMEELNIGDPALLETDIGPVIDEASRLKLELHTGHMRHVGQLLYACELNEDHRRGSFVAPHVFEIERLSLLEREVFGPVLHVIRYPAAKLDTVIDAINATRFGLTLGVHSRIDTTVRHIQARARVGNIYVNRDMIGAVVGVQPFGGENLSGTGPKAGGPDYLLRFAVERTLTVNTAAVGGNTSLLSLAAC